MRPRSPVSDLYRRNTTRTRGSDITPRLTRVRLRHRYDTDVVSRTRRNEQNATSRYDEKGSRDDEEHHHDHEHDRRSDSGVRLVSHPATAISPYSNSSPVLLGRDVSWLPPTFQLGRKHHATHNSNRSNSNLLHLTNSTPPSNFEPQDSKRREWRRSRRVELPERDGADTVHVLLLR